MMRGMMGRGPMGQEGATGGKSDRMEGMGHGSDEHGHDDEGDNSDEQ